MKKEKGIHIQLYKFANAAIFIVCFVVILIVDMFVGYSSGDDVAHRLLAEKYNLWEFIRNCETSRISKKISLYYVMRSNIMVWRILNAMIFTVFVGAISKIVFVVKRVSDVKKQFYIRFVLLVSMCFAHISIVGFTVFWVTGTQDYLWPLTFGTISLIPDIQCTYGKPMKVMTFLGAVFCAVWGGLGQEQISFMLACVAFLNYICERTGGIAKKERKFSFALLLIRVLCFLCLVLGPMNQVRLAESSYYTGFRDLTFVKHIFLTAQWVLSAFANELKLVFISIWIILGGNFVNKNRKKFYITAIFIIIAMPSLFGISFLNTMGIETITDMGIVVENIVKATDNTVSYGTMSRWNWISLAWWMIATMIVTPYLLKDRKICCYLYSLGILLPFMMIVSPSMYVSGGRVFWTSAVLFCSIIGMLLTEKFIENKLAMVAGVATIFGIYEIGIDAVYFINNLVN